MAAVQRISACREQQRAHQQVLDVVEHLRGELSVQQGQILSPEFAHGVESAY